LCSFLKHASKTHIQFSFKTKGQVKYWLEIQINEKNKNKWLEINKNYYVVSNAGFAHSGETLKLSSFYFKLMTESINQQSVPKMAHLLLKSLSKFLNCIVYLFNDNLKCAQANLNTFTKDLIL